MCIDHAPLTYLVRKASCGRTSEGHRELQGKEKTPERCSAYLEYLTYSEEGGLGFYLSYFEIKMAKHLEFRSVDLNFSNTISGLKVADCVPVIAKISFALSDESDAHLQKSLPVKALYIMNLNSTTKVWRKRE